MLNARTGGGRGWVRGKRRFFLGARLPSWEFERYWRRVFCCGFAAPRGDDSQGSVLGEGGSRGRRSTREREWRRVVLAVVCFVT